MSHRDPAERADFEDLVQRHYRQVCAVAYAVLRDRARSEEVAQDAFLVAWRARATTPLTVGWLCGIARNLARNAARRRTEVPMTPTTPDPAAPAADARTSLIAREDAARATAALARLSEAERAALVLYYRGDQVFADVAAALGISEATARQRVHRARTRLRELLAPVEATLRATRPGPAFVAACVGAWAIGKATPAAALPRPPGAPGARWWGAPAAGLAALGVAACVVALAVRQAPATAPARAAPAALVGAGVAPRSAAEARAALRARFPGSARPAPPVALPPGSVALGASSEAAAPAPSAPADEHLVDLELASVPLPDLAHVLADALDAPIWVAGPRDAHLDVDVRQRPALAALDDALAQVHANRVESAALRIVADGRTDAGALGGARISVDLHDAPLNYLLDTLEPALGMPIGRLGNEIPPGFVDEDGHPLSDPSPRVTVTATDAPAGEILAAALAQAHLGFELTTGFVVFADATP